MRFLIAGMLLAGWPCLTGATQDPRIEFGAAAVRAAGKSAAPVTIAKDLKPDAFRIRRKGSGYLVSGGDVRGAMYGALHLAEQLQLGQPVRETQVEPSLPIRALKFNIPLPGTGYLSEEDLANNQWFWDFGYWQKFFDMAARNRYNAITFWSAHPYDRMVRVPKYPEATALPAAELDRNIAFFRRLFQMAADRGLDTYLITWNIHVPRSFAERHQIAASGQDSPLIRDYQREAIKALFDTYPMLTGLGTTVGERMGRLTAHQKVEWIADTYFAALRQVKRPVPFILRYWQADPQEIAAMLDAVHYPAPVYLDIKFNGEHMYSSVKPHVEDRRWLDLAKGRYRLLWHLRNDDLFILRWGDPDFVRDVVRNMSGPDSAGFIEGSELDVPGVDRIHTPTAAAHLDWKYKFEKHWFRYMLWGRLGYNVDEPDDTWKAHFRKRFGAAGDDVYESMHQAGKICPLVTSYHWNYMNGDWYPEGSIGTWNTSHEQPRHNYRRATMYHDIRTWIFNNTIDPQYANIPEWLAGSQAEGPLQVAERLQGYSKRTFDLIGRASPKVERGQKEFTCTEADLRASAALGQYYAEKLQAAAHLVRFLFGAGEPERAESLVHLRRAVEAWRGVVSATENHYLPHEVWLFGQFDWKRYLPDVEADIQIARDLQPYRSTYADEGLHDWLVFAMKQDPKPEATAAVRLNAVDAVKLTPPLLREGQSVIMQGEAQKRDAESITGFRDFISPAASATYNVEIPADGRYLLRAKLSGSFAILVDESNTRPVTLNHALDLGQGRHTVRFFARAPGARLESFELVPSP